MMEMGNSMLDEDLWMWWTWACTTSLTVSPPEFQQADDVSPGDLQAEAKKNMAGTKVGNTHRK
jgi:hypothetical protein